MLIEEKGYNVMSLSKESGVPYTTIRSMIERNLTNASVDNVIKICKILGISVEALNSVPKGIAESKEAYETEHKVQIPLYGNIAAGALATVDGVTRNNMIHINIPEQLLGKHASNKDLFAMKVNGDSMNRVIPHGSFIVAKPLENEEIKDDDIVIFSHDGEYSLKRVRKDTEDKVLIFSPESHSRKFRDVVIPFDTPNELKIYAKVIWYSVTLD